MSLATAEEMTDKRSEESPSNRGEGKIPSRTERKAEGSRDDSADVPAVSDTDVADAADEAGSAFLPFDKVLSNPNKHK